MADITDEQLIAMVEKMPSSEFKNEHGEKFTIFSNGTLVYMRGDETANDVVNLFSDAFNIWSNEEIFKLGHALQELAIENGYESQQ